MDANSGPWSTSNRPEWPEYQIPPYGAFIKFLVERAIAELPGIKAGEYIHFENSRLTGYVVRVGDEFRPDLVDVLVANGKPWKV